MICAKTYGAVRENYTLVNKSVAVLASKNVLKKVYVKFNKYKINKIELLDTYCVY